jgi:hypothetical protein
MQFSLFLQQLEWKKTRPGGGGGYFLLREKTISRRSRKPPPHPYTAASQPVRERPGLALDLCFGMGHARGFFLCDTADLPPRGSNPGGLGGSRQPQPPSYKLVRSNWNDRGKVIYIFICTLRKLCSTTRKPEHIALIVHPVLDGLFNCKALVGYIGIRNKITALWPWKGVT